MHNGLGLRRAGDGHTFAVNEKAMPENQTSSTATPRAPSPPATRREHREQLRQKEEHLEGLVDAQNKKEFFSEILPFLKPLKSYIKRRLRISYLTSELRNHVFTSGDFLDDLVLHAYEHYEEKPRDLSLEEWLYQLANARLEKYFNKRVSTEKRRRSLEALTQAELRSLDEMPITADAEGEVWFPEELDDGEYHKYDFYPPGYNPDPETQLERREELQQIVRALARVPEKDRVVFELFAVEGFPKEAVAKIANVTPAELPKIAEKVKAQVRQEIDAPQAARTGDHNRQAS